MFSLAMHVKTTANQLGILLCRWAFRDEHRTALTIKAMALSLQCVGIVAGKVQRLLSGDFKCLANALFRFSRVHVGWSRPEISRFLLALNQLADLPTIKQGMTRVGMQNLFQQYWLRQTLLRKNPDSMDVLQHPVIWIPGLRKSEFFGPKEFSWSSEFQSKAEAIRSELLSIIEHHDLFGSYRNELGMDRHPFSQSKSQSTKAYQDGDWQVCYLYRCGRLIQENAHRFPQTIQALNQIPNLDKTFVMFSLLKPGTWIPPHYGLSNALLRVHLPLQVPASGCSIRVGRETRSWRKDEIMIFDDSYQHEVWNESNQTRIVLFFNVFHPDLQPHEVSQMKQFLYEELNRVPAVKFWNQSQADHHLGESTQMAL